ncbi:MAG: hypothetical protein IJ511_07850 [Bacteroides sp.]|nr:hypothetical protein [Bacteroides sp.]
MIPVIWSKGKFVHKGDTLVCMDSDKKKEIRFLKQKNKLLCISHTGFSLKDSPSNKRKIFVSEVPQPVDAYSDEGDVVYSIKEVCIAELLKKVPLFRNHLYAMEDSLKLTIWLPNDSIKAVNTPFRNLDFIPYRILPILWEGDSPSRH